ncbi:MAG: DUF819 family protein [Eubacteriales bacterium]|nr:DUF819 family protein [Eubacteriales bacterium]
MITNEPALMALMAILVAFAIYASEKLPVFRSLGSPVVAVLLGIICVNVGLVPVSADLYDRIIPYAVYLSIILMLLNVDIKKMFSLSRRPLLAMGLACVAIAIGATVGGVIMRNIENGWQLSGMFVGTYTGGSANLTAIGYALGASSETLAAANAADYVIGTPMVLLLFAMPAIYKKSKWLQKVWPYKLDEADLHSDAEEDQLMGDKTWNIQDIAISLAIALIIFVLGSKIGLLAPESFSEALTVLAVTTIAIILAQFKPVQNLRGTMDLGMFFALYYLVMIGFMVSIPAFLDSALTIVVLCAIVMGVSFILHLLLCRLFKIEWQYVVISITAAIWDGPTAALNATGANWQSLVGISVILGVIGHAVGNYLGIGIGYLIKALLH